ncbi:MAG: hypothetical protein HQK87_05195 [Nitrospinae bacterium]|nr:hypothetical protein [Nitrospinota bacterium]
MTGLFIGITLVGVVLFFVVNGWYLSKDMGEDPYDPFDETADREAEEAAKKRDEKP